MFAVSVKGALGKQINGKKLKGMFVALNKMFPINLKEHIGCYADFKLTSI